MISVPMSLNSALGRMPLLKETFPQVNMRIFLFVSEEEIQVTFSDIGEVLGWNVTKREWVRIPTPNPQVIIKVEEIE